MWIMTTEKDIRELERKGKKYEWATYILLLSVIIWVILEWWIVMGIVIVSTVFTVVKTYGIYTQIDEWEDEEKT